MKQLTELEKSVTCKAGKSDMPQEPFYEAELIGPHPAPLQLELEKYRSDLKTLHLSAEQENEVLNALWGIMSSVVNLGFGAESIQVMFPELFADGNRAVLEENNASEFNRVAGD